MEVIPNDFKRLLFNKEANEALSAEEQATWESFLAWDKTKKMNVGDPDFQEKLFLYFKLTKNEATNWQTIENELNRLSDKKITPIIKSKLIDNWQFRVAAAVFLVLAMGALWFFYNSKMGTTDITVNTNATLTTTIGRALTGILPDGSKVILSAQSSLTCPARFGGLDREVMLVGEAFFEVKSNHQKPFKIKLHKATVLARGTSFNIKAYPDDTSVTVTLLTGLIEVKNNGKHQNINPGQQAIITEHDIVVKDNINTDHAIAWKKGLINLEGESIRSIMEQIRHWYGVDYFIKDEVILNEMVNKIKKTRTLAELINILNVVMSNIHFQLDNNRIIVESKK